MTIPSACPMDVTALFSELRVNKIEDHPYYHYIPEALEALCNLGEAIRNLGQVGCMRAAALNLQFTILRIQTEEDSLQEEFEQQLLHSNLLKAVIEKIHSAELVLKKNFRRMSCRP